MSSFPHQLALVQEQREDFEWYPTTNEILAALKADIESHLGSEHRLCPGFLDIGAGNGKVLESLKDIEDLGNRYAIEKSHALIGMLDASVFVLGCDFWNTSLVDKDVGIIFSNPPYKEFEPWATKLMKEAPPGARIYLVLPQRWQKSTSIEREILTRKGSTEILGTYDFEDAEDRKARAKVHLIRIALPGRDRYTREYDGPDPFERFFHETFTFPEKKPAEPFEQKLEETKVVQRLNFIEALAHLYDLRMQELHTNYQAVCALSPDILKEFDISKGGLMASLQMKLRTAKKEYWQRLFDGMAEIQSRLTKKSRRHLQELMQSQTGIDFNRDNAYAIVIWVIKNANGYFDEQLIETYENLVTHANVENYVSNQRVFKWNRFAYRHARDENATHYRLKVGHRIVLECMGGLKREQYCWQKGLEERAADFICDLLTIAQNLGFHTIDRGPQPYSYDDSDTRTWRFFVKGKGLESLFQVRAFLNGNLHMQFHPDFIHALNVQHGILKGWLRDDAEAATELEIPIEVARKHFKPGYRLTATSLNCLRLSA
jgi:hypothetical protein